jgi:hypothetical protein
MSQSNHSISFHQSILENQLKLRNAPSKLKAIPTLGESKKKLAMLMPIEKRISRCSAKSSKNN